MYMPSGDFIKLTPDWFRLYAKYDYRGVEILHFKNVKVIGFAAKLPCGKIIRAAIREEIAEAIDVVLDAKERE